MTSRVKTARVLVVDDQIPVLQLFSLMMKREGHTCIPASSRCEAIQILQNDIDIDAVIIDFQLDDGSVEELVAEISQIRPESVLIGTSGQDRADDFLKMGVDEFLFKPWPMAGFSEILNRRLS